ncbi:MAG: hypothetical protein NTW86_14955, partial [Candidatus Sumerlaeota bacterium]|nr:hypothetical protein [Candidatus Sumerlaeota bacterium]
MLAKHVALAAILFIAASASMFAEDFEHGMPKDWKAGAEWQVVEEPGHPGNHVLSARVGKTGASVRFGPTDERDSRLSARFLFRDFQGQYFHVKFASRINEPEGSCYLNVRDKQAVIILHRGQQFTELAEIGSQALKPDRWYRVEFACSGPILSGSVVDTVSGETVAQGRAIDDSLQAGGHALMIALPQGGSGEFMFDDVEVAPLQPSEMPRGQTHVLENETVRLEFDTALGQWSLTDKRTGKTWSSCLQAAPPL